jgi:hypothetical protein
MRQSPNQTERETLLIGFNPHHEYPITVDLELLLEHMHITGATGSGKTSLGVIPLIQKLIRNEEACLILDLKGDNAMFHTAKEEAKKTGRPFKWFTNRPNHATYVFNPFVQEHLKSLTVADVTGFFIASLNMHHGSDYGRAYFSLMARDFLQHALKRSLGMQRSSKGMTAVSPATKPIQNFADLHAVLTELAATDDRYKNASHLASVIRNLADFPQLNMSVGASVDSQKQSAIEQAIHMPDVIAEKQVAYFYLSPAFDVTSVVEMARLAIYAAINAAVAHREKTGKRARIFLICDEAQHIIGQNISNVLAQARSHGVGCILAHQTLSQLNPPGGVDLRDLVLNCTAIKQFWAARDPNTREYISQISGEVTNYNASWSQLKRRVLGGEIGRRFAAGTTDEPLMINVSEQVGPRLSSQDIENYSRQPNTSIMAIHRNEGYSCYDGAFPVVTPWAMSKEEYTRRSHEIPWPKESDETIVVTPDWDPERFAEPASSEPAQEHVEPTDFLNHLHQDFDLPSS